MNRSQVINYKIKSRISYQSWKLNNEIVEIQLNI